MAFESKSSSVASIIERISAYAKKQLPPKEASLIDKFTRLYYANIALEDIQERSIPDLYGIVLSHWELIYQRKPNQLKISLFNPNYEGRGWQSTHTIIQIITDDMPFLIDSIRMEINRLKLTTHLMIYIGGIKVCRNKRFNIEDILSYHASHDLKTSIEAPLYMEIDRQTDPKILADIQRNIRRVLKDVRAAVEDWEPIKQRVQESIDELDPTHMRQNPEEITESKAFLKWMLDDHFTFLGFRDYEMVGEGQEKALRLVPHSGLGVLRDDTHSKMLRQYSDLPQKARKIALSTDQILIMSKTNTISTVHRPAYTDYIGVKRFNEKGELIGERRFIGLYTSIAYTGDPKIIPLLRRKVELVTQKSALPVKSHAGKDLLHILSNLPRDDLFHATTEELYELAMSILHLQERRHIRLFVRRDAYGRFMSCLVYVPRENFNTTLVNMMRDILCKAFHGLDISFATYFSESVLARIHYVIRIDPRKRLEYEVKEIEKKLIEVGESWEDGFHTSILGHFGEEHGNALFNHYRTAFSVSYQEAFQPAQAVFDVEHVEKLSGKKELGMSFYRPLGVPKEVIRFKLFNHEYTVPLSDALPLLENMGLRVIGEQPYKLSFNDGSSVWINDFSMTYAKEPTFDVEEVKTIFQEAFQKTWNGEAENDALNRLVLEAELNWREISILRAYSKYFRQAGFTFSQEYIAETLVNNAKIACLLVELFKLYFDPTKTQKEETTHLEQKIINSLDDVAILDEDRIIRRYLALIRATLRTNYFQMDAPENYKPYLSFKLDPTKIPELPKPLPTFEIFVYSPRFEGIHLRAAKIARGGIRWSDRREDYRTEILSLMKAQQVKNAVIVPSGAKGGFVTKNLTPDAPRETLIEEAIICYKGFISGLLDLTDNLQDGHIISPKNTICYDSEDPYLVVAADKGTATFSDIANTIAIERNYWMLDAFASGGSTGYDHKKMGITARGAWVSAEQHFKELGTNVDETEITVIGIGDMSGDVFGNGMLMSDKIKLVAAFDHRHIFLDPHPSSKTSYAERLRLFNLPRSSWDDYDRKLLSDGGGIYSRSAKAIRISEQVKTLLDIKKDVLVPNQLIRAILKAKVDLIWNGGIGTYVKASTETNDMVGDRTNDGVRINGKSLRARVVCEGGNLGLTQLGRIEYELSGGRINTDFIDNSAGVDCSDHEVNIKILLNSIMHSGDLTEKQRNNLLSSMTDEVAQLVLKDNYQQNQAISLASFLSYWDIPIYMRYLTALEEKGKIDRALEFLPDDKTLLGRRSAGTGLTRPELSIIFAYTKNILEDSIKESELVNDPYLSKFVEHAFPLPLRESYAEEMKSHYLANPIIATQLTNRMVSEMGITFAHQMSDETGATVDMIVRAYVIASNLFNMGQTLRDIESLNYKVDVKTQNAMILDVMRLVRRTTRWFLRNCRGQIDVLNTINHYADRIQEIYTRLPKLLLGEDRQALEERQNKLIGKQVSPDIAFKISSCPTIFHALNIIEAAASHEIEPFRVAKTYFMLADRMNFFWFRERVNTYPAENRWAVIARAGYKGDLDWIQRELTVRVLVDTNARSIPGKINEWLSHHDLLIQRWKSILADMRSADTKNFDILFVAIRDLLDLTTETIRVAK